MQRHLPPALLLALALAPGCADQIGTSDPDAGAPSEGDASTESLAPMRHSDNGDGSTTTVVDATDAKTWVHFRFASPEPVQPADPATSADWDLAFQRFQIRVDGGISGAGGVEVAIVDGASFDEVGAAPADGYLSDAGDSDADEDSDPELVFTSAQGGWFDYDPSTHVLTPKDRVYVVRSVSGEHYKLRILDYYDEHGSSGALQFRWAPVAGPEGGS